MAEMDRLDDQFPPGLKWQLAFDNVVVVRESIIEVLKTLAEAIALVILVMFLFLQNWRSTIIPAITIPVSLIGTFAFVKLLGYSINTLTLFGIVLATGIVVDDAIVVIENIERHMREFGKSAHQAAIDAMREVFSAVVVIGIVLVAVFLPVAFFPGTTGRMYQQFSMTITFAVILSVFNAITFTPALSALLLDKESHAHGRFFTGVNRVIDARHERVRARACGGALRWKWAMAVVFVAGARRDVVGVSRRARRVRAGRGRRLLHHDRAGAVGRVDRIHDEHHEGGRADLLQAAGDRGRVLGRRLQLQRRGVEQRADVRAAEGLRGARGRRALARDGAEPACAARCSAFPGAMVIPVAPPAIQGVSAFGGFQFEMLDLGGGDITQLASVTQQVAGAGNQSGRVAGLFSSLHGERPAARRDDRSRQGASARPADPRGDRRAGGAARVAVRERLRLQQPRVSRVRAGRSAVPRAAGRPEPVLRARRRTATWCRCRPSCAPAKRRRRRSSIISTCSARRKSPGSALPGVSSGQALQEMERIARETLPQGYDFAWAGLSLEEIKVGQPGGVSLRAVASCSSIWCSRRSTRAGCCRSSFCSACRWRCSAR